MNGSWIDLAIACVIILSMITGLFRGFIKESVALCIWVFAFWFAFHYGTKLDPWLSPYIQDYTLRTIIEFLIILFLSLIMGGVVNMVIGFMLSRSGLSGTDRLFGMGFGFLRGIFIVAVLMLGVRMTGMPTEPYSQGSTLYPKFAPLVNWLSGYVPSFIKQVQLYDKTGAAIVSIAHDD